jgi:hypothetical protein
LAENNLDEDEADWCVFGTVAGTDRLIAKSSAVLPSTYVQEYGPATREECERYMRGG